MKDAIKTELLNWIEGELVDYQEAIQQLINEYSSCDMTEEIAVEILDISGISSFKTTDNTYYLKSDIDEQLDITSLIADILG